MRLIFCAILLLFFSSLVLAEPTSFVFGVGTHVIGRPKDVRSAQLEMMKSMNLESFRADVPWKWVEQQKGVFAIPTA